MRAGMGTILQERVPQQCLQRVSTREPEWKKKAPWSNNRPNASSNKMGRRQSQRKPLQPQYMLPSQENNNLQRLQQRKKHKPHTSSTKSNMSKHSAQGPSKSRPPAEDWAEPKAQHPSRDQKLTVFRAKRRTAAFPCHRLSDSSPDLLQGLSPRGEGGDLSVLRDGDSDSDLSELERLPLSPRRRVPPKLDLRPEVIEADHTSTSAPTSHRRPRSHCHTDFNFPDFLPPPFNSWSLSQLAVFYNMEGRVAPRPRAVGPLERYLERLLQLEWSQIQTAQEESGKPAGSEVISSCHRAPAAASSRLSSPKCILQCQRAFPLTFLSSLASHSALLSGCACTLCRIRYSTCSTSCCRSAHIQVRQSRPSPMTDRRGPGSLPRRSYSESRVHPAADRASASRTQRFSSSPVRTSSSPVRTSSSPVRTSSSPVRTSSSHLRRMQAVGNIRNPVHGANNNNKLHSTARDLSVRAGRDHPGSRGDVLDFRTGGFRRRSGSEQRRTGSERQHHASEKRRSGSECRRGGEHRRTTDLREIKPDAVAAIMDNLPGPKPCPVDRPNRTKQVEFIT